MKQRIKRPSFQPLKRSQPLPKLPPKPLPVRPDLDAMLADRIKDLDFQPPAEENPPLWQNDDAEQMFLHGVVSTYKVKWVAANHRADFSGSLNEILASGVTSVVLLLGRNAPANSGPWLSYIWLGFADQIAGRSSSWFLPDRKSDGKDDEFFLFQGRPTSDLDWVHTFLQSDQRKTCTAKIWRFAEQTAFSDLAIESNP